jgi:hypothetical protein
MQIVRPHPVSHFVVLHFLGTIGKVGFHRTIYFWQTVGHFVIPTTAKRSSVSVSNDTCPLQESLSAPTPSRPPHVLVCFGQVQKRLTQVSRQLTIFINLSQRGQDDRGGENLSRHDGTRRPMCRAGSSRAIASSTTRVVHGALRRMRHVLTFLGVRAKDFHLVLHEHFAQ